MLIVQKGVFDNGMPISDVVKSVTISGLGTGVGDMSAELCALQMRIAYGRVVLGETGFPESWIDAREIQLILEGHHL